MFEYFPKLLYITKRVIERKESEKTSEMQDKKEQFKDRASKNYLTWFE